MSSNDIAIKVENISKLYRIGAKQKMHDSVGGTIIDFIKSPIRNYQKYRSLYKFDERNPDSSPNSTDVIWAVKGVSFEVKQGEVLGIIGRNGAGKSTLLKILCQITHPTTGSAIINGRISSLLEVGTGFHQELTGRENVYLNGTILGMTKKEVDRKFDEIVSFSGVERFIDTPVKRYSSGMKVRLAFSVAAHLEPEIFMVDEVLAVGDATFQRKCLDKMENVGRGGRTVLFVSHNLTAIQALCSKAIWLEGGKILKRGESNKVIAAYLKNNFQIREQIRFDAKTERKGNGKIRFKKVNLYDEDEKAISLVQTGKPLTIGLEYVLQKKNDLPCVFQIVFKDMFGQNLFTCLSRASHNEILRIADNGEIQCRIAKLSLLSGRYSCRISCKLNEVMADSIEDAFVLNVIDGDFFGTGKLQPNDCGSMVIEHSWKIK